MGHKVGVIGGDGIGPEVIAEALKVVRAAGVALDTIDFDLGGARYLRDGEILPDDELDELARASTPSCSAPSARPTCRPASSSAGLLLKMRFELDLYVNQRRSSYPDGTTSTWS